VEFRAIVGGSRAKPASVVIIAAFAAAKKKFAFIASAELQKCKKLHANSLALATAVASAVQSEC